MKLTQKVVINKVCHSQVLRTATVRDIAVVDPALPDNTPAKGHTSAFTLIELLVVVLIIGILAAVALPQYRVAVAKAHLAKYLPAVHALYEAEQAFYLTNGEYTRDLKALDVDFAGSECTYRELRAHTVYQCPDVSIGIYDNATNVQVQVQNIGYARWLVNIEDDDFNEIMTKGEMTCFAGDEVAKKACRSLGSIAKEKEVEVGPWIYWVKLK